MQLIQEEGHTKYVWLENKNSNCLEFCMEQIDVAIRILENNIVEVCTVTEWAELMVYPSTAYFSRKIRTTYKKSPSKLIQQAKLKLITSLFKKHPNQIYFFIAVEAGFANYQSLAKFIKHTTGKTVTEFKSECEIGV